MSQPRRPPPDHDPVDRVREALRYHDERLEQDVENTERDREPDDTLERDGPAEHEQDRSADA